jgi:hypothetical protein
LKKWRVKLQIRRVQNGSAKVKECVELYIHSPNTPLWRDAQLVRKLQMENTVGSSESIE